MARADLLLSLVRAGTTGDQMLFRKTVEALIAEERAKKHEVLAGQLEDQIQRTSNGGNGVGPNKVAESLRSEMVPARPLTPLDLLAELTPRRQLDDLVLESRVREIVNDVVQEHHRSDLLRSYNLEPRHRLLFIGPPGNGKTSLAEALANALMVPLVVARYEGLITSYLGETASRLRRLFEYARTRRCVLFFDEFDTVGKERGDIHETGEIKRVVSSLLLQIDSLPAHVVVVTATNHPELLDRAVWRRFQVRLELGPPTRQQAEEYFERAAKSLKIGFGFSPRTLADRLRRASFSELESFLDDVARTYVLALPEADIRKITSAALQRRLKQVPVPKQSK